MITDYSMPERDGVSLIKELRKTNQQGQLAIIGLSASDEAALTAKFLKAGANDFLKKAVQPRRVLLPPAQHP